MRDTAAMTKTMMVAGLWILALGMPLTATAAQDAETMTANLLVNNCQAVDKPYSQRTIDDWAGASACLSYFYGWMDGTRAVAVIIGAQIWCPAADVTVGQMRKVFLK